MSAAAEQARLIMHLDALARVHVGRDCTLRARADDDGRLRIIITRPCGAGVEVVARGDADEVRLQLTSGRRP